MVDLEKVIRAMQDAAPDEVNENVMAEEWPVIARAAFASIMEQIAEPSDEMMKAGCVALGSPEAQDALMTAELSGQRNTFARIKMRLRWRAMHAKLKEQPNAD